MKSFNKMHAAMCLFAIALFAGCEMTPEPIGYDLVGEYTIDYSYEVYNDPWIGGSYTVNYSDTTFRIELVDMDGNFIIHAKTRYDQPILPAVYVDGTLDVPPYYFYPPGITAHSVWATVSFKGDSIFVDMLEHYTDWPYGGDGYNMIGKGLRK